MNRKLVYTKFIWIVVSAFTLAGCGGGGSGSGSGSSQVPTDADVLVNVEASASPIVAGGKGSFAVSVTNQGPDLAKDINIELSLDSKLTLGLIQCQAAAGAVCPASPSSKFAVAQLPKGGSLKLDVEGLVAQDAVGSLSLAVTASTAADGKSGNNSASASIRAVARNSITLVSDASDYIGQGRQYAYDQSNAELTVVPEGGGLRIGVTGDQYWYGRIVLPARYSVLTPGTYSSLSRWPFHVPADGGLDWSGEARGCNTLIGSVTISKAIYSGSTLQELDLTFLQRCEGANSSLRGAVHWTAFDTSLPPGPIKPVPAGLWDADPSLLPSTGSYVYLESQAGDYIGNGRTYLYRAAAGDPLSLRPQQGGVAINTGNATDYWIGEFVPMSKMTKLEPGYYGALMRYPFHNPVRGGLAWWGSGRACNRLIGWFVVDAVTYEVGEVTALNLRFEQRCDGGTAALRGKIRWVK
jgi:hypothetical protein